MNYLKLRNLIIGVTVVALAVSVLALGLGLLLPMGTLDLQGASGLASIIPAFAGVLIAAFALYSYNKLEDADYAKSRELVAQRDDLIAHLRLAAYSVATAMRFDQANCAMHEKRLLEELQANGSFRGFDGQIYKGEKAELVGKVIAQHAAAFGRRVSNLQLESALNHLEKRIAESMTVLTPLVLDHFRDEPQKIKQWLTNFQAIIYGFHAFDQPNQRETGLANIVRGSKLIVELLKDSFFSSTQEVYKALLASKADLDVPPSVVEMLDEMDAQFEELAFRSNSAE